MKAQIQQSLQLVQKWVEDRGYKGYDPGDGLTSYLRPLAFGNLFAERILQQAIWIALAQRLHQRGLAGTHRAANAYS